MKLLKITLNFIRNYVNKSRCVRPECRTKYGVSKDEKKLQSIGLKIISSKLMKSELRSNDKTGFYGLLISISSIIVFLLNAKKNYNNYQQQFDDANRYSKKEVTFNDHSVLNKKDYFYNKTLKSLLLSIPSFITALISYKLLKKVNYGSK